MRRAARWLSVGGVVVAVVALSAYHARYVAVPPYPLTGTFRFMWMISYIVLISVGTYAVGLPDQPRNKRQAAWLALLSTGIGAAGISLVQLATGDALLPRFVVFGSALVNVPLQIIVNWLSRRGRSRDEDRDRVILIGGQQEHSRFVDDLQLEPEHGAMLVGFVTVSECELGDDDERSLLNLQRSTRATLVVLDHEAQASEAVIAQAARLHEAGVRVRTLEAFYAHWLGKLPLSELERASLFFDIGELHGGSYARLMRVIDLGVALYGTLILLLVTPFVWLGNLAGNRGPLIFRQPRVGKGGQEFVILKFRTMRTTESSRSANSQWTSIDDPRVTPFGRFLRKSHLDELPQMINILSGELSIVGPRPEQPHYVRELNDKLAFYSLRHLVRPGLTGWAQVKYGYAGDEEDALEKLQYEFFYLQNQDLAFNLQIMLRTMRSVVGGRGGGR